MVDFFQKSFIQNLSCISLCIFYLTRKDLMFSGLKIMQRKRKRLLTDWLLFDWEKVMIIWDGFWYARPGGSTSIPLGHFFIRLGIKRECSRSHCPVLEIFTLMTAMMGQKEKAAAVGVGILVRRTLLPTRPDYYY